MFFCLSRQSVFYVFDSFIVFYDIHISLPTLPSPLFPLLIPLPAPFSCSQPAPVLCRSKITKVSPCGFPDSDTTISCGSVAGRQPSQRPSFGFPWPAHGKSAAIVHRR